MLEDLVQELREKHGCHTVILYGSRARGDNRENSDIDVFCINDLGDSTTDARLWRGLYLDAWIVPQQAISDPANYLHLRDGKILYEENGVGSRLLEWVRKRFEEGREPMSQGKYEHYLLWFQKMLKRSSSGDVEANYRRHWMLVDLLQVYFEAQGEWYLGCKLSFEWLQENQPEMYRFFEQIYRPGATQAELEEGVENILQYMSTLRQALPGFEA